MTSCEQYQEPINVVGNSWLGYQPFYVQNILHPELVPDQVNVTMLVSDVSVVRMLTNQAASVAFLSLDNALSLNSRTELGFCIASVLSSSEGADVIFAHPDAIDKLNSDEPLRVAMEDSALSRFILSRWVTRQQIDESRIQRQIVSPAGQLRAFGLNQFDLVITYAPYSKSLEQAGAISLFSSREISGEILDVVIVRETTWQKNQSLLQRYISRNWDQAIASIQNPGKDGFSTLAKLADLSEQELQSVLTEIHWYDAAASREFLQQRYAQTAATVAQHLIDSGLHARIRPLPVCEGML